MEKDKGNILIKTIIVFIILLIILSLGFLAHLYLQEIELSEEEPKNIIATFEKLEKNVNTKKDNNQTVEVVMPIINEKQKEVYEKATSIGTEKEINMERGFKHVKWHN